MPAQQWAYEAGASEEAGRVREPRQRESRGQQENRSSRAAKADGGHAPDGTTPVCDMASAQATTGVCERGMASQGERGNVGAPPVSVPHSRHGGPGDHRPWRALGASPRS